MTSESETESTSARTNGNEKSCGTGKYCKYNHESASVVMGVKNEETRYPKGEVVLLLCVVHYDFISPYIREFFLKKTLIYTLSIQG